MFASKFNVHRCFQVVGNVWKACSTTGSLKEAFDWLAGPEVSGMFEKFFTTARARSKVAKQDLVNISYMPYASVKEF